MSSGKIVQTDRMRRDALERVAYGLEEASTAFGVSTNTLVKFIRAGRLRVFHVGRRVLVKKSDLQSLADSLCDAENGSLADATR